MLDTELLKILCCPETHQELRVADAALVEKLNARMAAGESRNRAGRKLTERIEGGFVRGDGKYLYPLRGRIPILLVDEAIEAG